MKRTKEQILKLDELGVTRTLLGEQKDYASFNLEWVTLTTKMSAMSWWEAKDRYCAALGIARRRDDCLMLRAIELLEQKHPKLTRYRKFAVY